MIQKDQDFAHIANAHKFLKPDQTRFAADQCFGAFNQFHGVSEQDQGVGGSCNIRSCEFQWTLIFLKVNT